jgi:hypothetical protein
MRIPFVLDDRLGDRVEKAALWRRAGWRAA